MRSPTPKAVVVLLLIVGALGIGARYSGGAMFGELAGKCGYYPNSSGERIPSPCGDWRDNPTPPAGATARCRDGSWSWSQHPDYWGTCSHHGGVESYLSLHP